VCVCVCVCVFVCVENTISAVRARKKDLIATHDKILQHTATTLQRTSPHCNTRRQIATRCSTFSTVRAGRKGLSTFQITEKNDGALTIITCVCTYTYMYRYNLNIYIYIYMYIYVYICIYMYLVDSQEKRWGVDDHHLCVSIYIYI